MPSPSLTGRDDEDRSLRELRGSWSYHEYAVTLPGCGWVEEADGTTVGQYIDLRYGALVAAAPDMYEALRCVSGLDIDPRVLKIVDAALSQATAKQER